jgi:hypothetical protein
MSPSSERVDELTVCVRRVIRLVKQSPITTGSGP